MPLFLTATLLLKASFPMFQTPTNGRMARRLLHPLIQETLEAKAQTLTKEVLKVAEQELNQ